MHRHHIYGTATVNDKGQIVIPADARKALGIEPDTKLVVIGGGFGNALCIIRADEFEKKMQGVMGWFVKNTPSA